MQIPPPKRLAGVFTNKPTKPFAHLSRLRRCGIKGARPNIRAEMRHHVYRHGVGLFEPRYEIAAICQPFDLLVPGGCDAVQKIEREIIADEEGSGARLNH